MPSLKSHLLGLLTRRPVLYSTALKLKGTLTAELRAFSCLVKADDTVFDIGANRGHFTLLFSMLAGRRGQVHAFEPVPPTFQKLSTHLVVEAVYSNTHLVNAAAADCTGQFPIYMPGDDDGQASLAHHQAGSWRDCRAPAEYQCDALRLDDYITEQRLARLDFVKCDVEGAELPALRGAASALAKWRPSLYVEVNPDWTSAFGYSPRDLWDFLTSLGYEHIYHVSINSPYPVLLSEAEFARLGGYSNLLCVSPRRYPCAF